MDETETNSTSVTAVVAPDAPAPASLPEPVAIDPMLAESLPLEISEAVFMPEVVPESDSTLREVPESVLVSPSEIPEPTPNPVQAQEEPRVVERVVEKIVEKEVIKEVPVEKIVEKIVEVEKPVEKIVEKVVYRDAEPKVCPPPTDDEIEAIHKDFLIRLSKEGTAKKHELMIEKMDRILTLFNTKPNIVREDVMDLLECSSTTATRLLTELKHDGRITPQGHGGKSTSYTKPS